jgi:hypothetical protein
MSPPAKFNLVLPESDPSGEEAVLRSEKDDGEEAEDEEVEDEEAKDEEAEDEKEENNRKRASYASSLHPFAKNESKCEEFNLQFYRKCSKWKKTLDDFFFPDEPIKV